MERISARTFAADVRPLGSAKLIRWTAVEERRNHLRQKTGRETMKSTGYIFLLVGLVFMILSLTGDMPLTLGIVFVVLGIVFSYTDSKKKTKNRKGNA